MLDEIKNALTGYEGMKEPMYGRVNNNFEEWNYFVFNTKTIRKAGTSKKDFNTYYQVHIVHENFIPEEMVFDVIKKVVAGTGLRLSDVAIDYNYSLKLNTNIVVEMASITFVKAKKGSDVI